MRGALPEDHPPFDNPFPDLGKVLGPGLPAGPHLQEEGKGAPT